MCVLLCSGATIVGKTHMSELAYSLDGNNAHYGTPLNPAAPGRNTGGSSSGSAVSAQALVAQWPVKATVMSGGTAD
jgi:amidase